MARLYDEPVIRLMGDRALLVELGDSIDPGINRKVHAMALSLEREKPRGIIEVVPTYRCFSITYDPLILDLKGLRDIIRSAEERLSEIEILSPSTVEIPVAYGGEFGPDLEFVAESHGMGIEQVVEIHSGTLYRIYMIGFTPGFAYLGGLAEELHTPRLPTPRPVVPAGSVGIAEKQTGMYAIQCPGGWRLIGRTPLRLFRPESEEPLLYRAGDTIRFVPVSESDYRRIASGGAS
jgi:inhibitor of KinA